MPPKKRKMTSEEEQRRMNYAYAIDHPSWVEKYGIPVSLPSDSSSDYDSDSSSDYYEAPPPPQPQSSHATLPANDRERQPDRHNDRKFLSSDSDDDSSTLASQYAVPSNDIHIGDIPSASQALMDLGDSTVKHATNAGFKFKTNSQQVYPTTFDTLFVAKKPQYRHEGTIATQHSEQTHTTPRYHSEIAFLQHIYNVDLFNEAILNQTTLGKERQKVLEAGKQPTRLKIYMRNSARPPCNYDGDEDGKKCDDVIK